MGVNYLVTKQTREESMLSAEYVMAVLCAPLKGKDLLLAEKSNNVIIIRRLDYDSQVDYLADRRLITSFENSPYKLMFIFNQSESVVVRSNDDWSEVNRRLARRA
jgi:hypothetical protein